jgi:NAD(P)-dependent dehydrogenase (short-subunit alcohol dehydrogenase family)
MSSSQRLNILILGGQSSIGKHFIQIIDKDCFNVYATTTGRLSLPLLPSFVNWILLDVTKEKSIDLFLENTSNTGFDVIINLIGKTSDLNPESVTQDVSEYFNSFISNLSFLLIGLVKYLPLDSDRKPLLINISSRAVKYGSFDPFYSAAKSAVHGLIKSLNKLYAPEIHFYNLVPGLLEDSTMFEGMSLNVRNQHRNRAGGSLMTVGEFAQYLNEFVLEKYNSNEIFDTDIMVGPQYI